MKRSVLCIFSLVLYLLLACTMLSAKIEEEMMPQVEVKTLKYKGTALSFSPDVLFHDEQGDHFYHAADGSGWESGLRIQEFMPAQYYYDIYDQIAFSGTPQTYHFIMSASRQPIEGEKVHVVEEFDEIQDQYLFYYPAGLPEETWMPQFIQVISHRPNTLLVETTQGRLPFFQHKAKTYSIAVSQADQVFSLSETRSFIQTLPSLVLVAILIISGIVLWGMTCVLSIQAKQNKKWIYSNIGLIVATLAVCSILLNYIDLPASLLPSTNIFDLNVYSETFSLVFDLLEQCGESVMFSLWERTIGKCLLLVLLGLILMGCIGFAERKGLWTSVKH